MGETLAKDGDSQEENEVVDKVQDLEVKDVSIIFNRVWSEIESRYGKEKLLFPKEIFWLNGAPGAGKGTHTRFIMKHRDFTEPPIVVSSLLKSNEAKSRMDAGLLVGDREVVKMVFEKLLDPAYHSGAIVDGFPRTQVQVACLKLLHHKISEIYSNSVHAGSNGHYKKPEFHIIVLFVDEKESVARQLRRGREILSHNEEVKESGMGKLIEIRKTDLDEQAAHNRYRTFKEQTYECLKSLREVFHFHYINAHGTVEEVRGRIIDELKYQSSLELNQQTFKRLVGIPIASDLAVHARQELVSRLDQYEEKHTDLFKQVVDLINEEFMPVVRRHAISGMALLSSEDTVFENPLALAMVIDVFSERGYHAVIDIRRKRIPRKFDPKTFEIENETRKVYRIRINFSPSEIRRGRR